MTRNKFLWTSCIKISAYKLCLAKVDSLGACGLGLIDCFSIIKIISDFQVIRYFALAGVTCLSTKVFSHESNMSDETDKILNKCPTYLKLSAIFDKVSPSCISYPVGSFLRKVMPWLISIRYTSESLFSNGNALLSFFNQFNNSTTERNVLNLPKRRTS